MFPRAFDQRGVGLIRSYTSGKVLLLELQQAKKDRFEHHKATRNQLLHVGGNAFLGHIQGPRDLLQPLITLGQSLLLSSRKPTIVIFLFKIELNHGQFQLFEILVHLIAVLNEFASTDYSFTPGIKHFQNIKAKSFIENSLGFS